LASPSDTHPPYSEAIAQLRNLDSKLTPAAKLRAMVDTCGAVVSDVAERAKNQQWPPGDEILSADLLLPILIWIVIRAGVPRLYSLTRFLEDFISESDEIHQEGYTLVTFQTCLAFIERLDETHMLTSAREQLSKLISVDESNIIINI
jgi:hypothetical protein